MLALSLIGLAGARKSCVKDPDSVENSDIIQINIGATAQ
jgi:hypothetical protein